MGELVRQRIDPQHKGEGARIVKVLRHQVFAQHNAVEPSSKGADQKADGQSFAEDPQGMAKNIALTPGNNALENQNRQ